jgi:protein-disulfide isomerase
MKSKRFGKTFFRGLGLVLMVLFSVVPSFGQEDRIVQAAIETVKLQARLPRDAEITFIEKRESPIPDFYSVKLLLTLPDREIPAIVYVDKTGEKVILGNLFVKGENVSQKEAGPPRRRKFDVALLEIEKSPVRGPSGAKVSIVEFSNFECPYCQKSWMKIREWMGKHPTDIQYVFKHYPPTSQGKISEVSEMAAAAQEISPEAFWSVHDFLFSNEGQALLKGERGKASEKIEQILREKGDDPAVFRSALDSGKAKRRVEADIATAKKVRVSGTPTILVNGEVFVGSIPDQVFQQYLGKK